MPKTIRLKILRQPDRNSPSHWETFEVPYQPNMNVISALLEVRKTPVTTDGKAVEPPIWESACLEEVCGACTMVINGNVRQACTALLDDVATLNGDALEVTLEPMKKMPLVRDLMVDRSKMFENLIKVKAWVPIDGSYDLGMAEPQDDSIRKLRYELSRCMTCGCCLEACPNYSDKTKFVGAQSIGQTLLFNLHPVGKALEPDRLDYMTTEEGITGCGNAQNCYKACPKDVPLLVAIARINRDTTLHKLKKFFGYGA